MGMEALGEKSSPGLSQIHFAAKKVIF